MGKIKKAICAVLFTVAIFGIFSEPEADSATWDMEFTISKTAGLAALGGLALIHKRETAKR